MKGTGNSDQIAIFHWITENQENSRKTSTSALLITPKPLTVGITTNCKILKDDAVKVLHSTCQQTGSWKKEKSSRKTSISALLTMPKLLTVWITINCEKF